MSGNVLEHDMSDTTTQSTPDRAKLLNAPCIAATGEYRTPRERVPARQADGFATVAHEEQAGACVALACDRDHRDARARTMFERSPVPVEAVERRRLPDRVKPSEGRGKIVDYLDLYQRGASGSATRAIERAVC